jgi:hypothetical protein
MKDLYKENYKPLKKEIEEDGKICHAHGLVESILWKGYITKNNLCLMQFPSKFQKQRLKNQSESSPINSQGNTEQKEQL